MSSYRFFYPNATQAITNAYVAIYRAEKLLPPDCQATISREEFVVCGGNLTKRNAPSCDTHVKVRDIMKRARYYLRRLAKKEIVLIERGKGPAAKQVDTHMRNTDAFLSDLPYYDESDTEDAENGILYVNSDDDAENADDEDDAENEDDEDDAENKDEDDNNADNKDEDEDAEDEEDAENKCDSDDDEEDEYKDGSDSDSSNESSDENDSECVD